MHARDYFWCRGLVSRVTLHMLNLPKQCWDSACDQKTESHIRFLYGCNSFLVCFFPQRERNKPMPARFDSPLPCSLLLTAGQGCEMTEREYFPPPQKKMKFLLCKTVRDCSELLNEARWAPRWPEGDFICASVGRNGCWSYVFSKGTQVREAMAVGVLVKEHRYGWRGPVPSRAGNSTKTSL